jgi:uncharacterized OsmC-like protein
MTETTDPQPIFDDQANQPREMKSMTLWEGGVKTNTIIRGFEIPTDEPLTDFGSNSSAAPAEVFLGSIGACLTAAYAWAAFASKLRLHAMRTTLNGRIETVNGIRKITHVKVSLKVTAKSNKPDKLERCFKIARDRCTLLNTLDCEKELDFTFKISEE